MNEIIEIKRKEYEVIEQIGEHTFKVERKGQYYFMKKYEDDPAGVACGGHPSAESLSVRGIVDDAGLEPFRDAAVRHVARGGALQLHRRPAHVRRVAGEPRA